MRNLRDLGQRVARLDELYERKSYQSLLWIQVERAAPMPVPVQIRMPRLNIAEA